MGIFSGIKDFLFGKKFISIGKDKPAAPPVARENPGQPSPAAPVANPPTASIIMDPVDDVDIAAILDQEAAKAGQTLNWRTSIVDLMKLCDIDPSFQNRKELAQELGYTGVYDGSADDNIWLHKQVLKKLAENGGKVPAELTD